MKRTLILLITCGILFLGCSTKENNPVKKEINAEYIKQLVISAANGNKAVNDTLRGLFDLTIPSAGELNKIAIDSLTTVSEKKYYLVLIEHHNPIYNRLALYDTELNAYLIDKSLNGNLNLSKPYPLNNRIFGVIENFISKDTLKLERLSLYQVDDSSAVLSLRIYTRLTKLRAEYSQTISEFTDERIKTSLISSRASSINNKGDVFLFDQISGSYKSENNIFNYFVADEVNNFKLKTQKPQIVDKQSASQSVGIIPGMDTITSTSNTDGNAGFSLTLTESWKELKNVSISNYLNKNFTGTRFINNSIGASIYVIPFASEDSTELYIDYTLTRSAEGIYRVRYTDKIEIGKNIVLFFEYSCGGKKYLLILESPKYTFDRYEASYLEIINTFFMEC